MRHTHPLDAIKLWFWSLFIFVAWLVAAEGWVRLLAVVWLAYPSLVVARVIRRRRGHEPDE